MAEITVTEVADNDLAEFVVVGTVSAGDIIAIARDHPGFRMRKHLVDMSNANFHSLDSVGLTRIADAFKEVETGRTGRTDGRTALVVSSHQNRLIAELFSVISTRLAGRPEKFQITSSRDDALSWLSENNIFEGQ